MISLSQKEQELLAKISSLNLNYDITQVKMAKLIGSNATRTAFRNVWKELLDEGILNYQSECLPSIFYRVDNAKLFEFLRQTDYFRLIGKIIEINVQMYRY